MHLVACDLHRAFDGRTVLAGISVELRSGESLAVTGPSGCGKSTLLRLLAGRDRPDRGSVAWDGARLDDATDAARAQWRQTTSAWLDQHPHLDGALNTRENVRLASAFRSLPQAEADADALLAWVELTTQAEQSATSLSGGQRVRAALARCLLTAPRVLFADEPTASLDPASARVVADLLLGLVGNGLMLVLATHDLAFAARCTRRLDLL